MDHGQTSKLNHVAPQDIMKSETTVSNVPLHFSGTQSVLNANHAPQDISITQHSTDVIAKCHAQLQDKLTQRLEDGECPADQKGTRRIWSDAISHAVVQQIFPFGMESIALNAQQYIIWSKRTPMLSLSRWIH